LTLTYKADVDTDGTQSTGSSDTAGSAGLDQTLSLAGSTKVGKWTSSATASQSLMEDGVTSKISGDDSAVITLTDGSITYKLGSAAHLSTAKKLLEPQQEEHKMLKHVLTASRGFPLVFQLVQEH